MTNDEFSQLFESFQHSLFRFEQLPEYSTGVEDEPLQRWRAHEDPPADIADTPWQSELRQWRFEGKTMQRVRAMASPMTDYLRMGVEWWYPHNIEAGEETFGLDVAKVEFELPKEDFWLFDDEIVAIMHYGPDGRFIGADLAEASEVPTYIEAKQRLLNAAEPLTTVYQRLLADA